MTLNVDFGKLEEDNEMLIQLREEVWLMDDHKWALLAWETHRHEEKGGSYALMHVDFHWDGIDDFQDSEEAQAELLAANLEELRAMTKPDEYIRYDSFIAPAVRRGTLAELHFFCLQDCGWDKGVNPDLCNKFRVPQILHGDVASLASVKPACPLIFDLCLDLFNRSNMYYQGDLWPDEEVLTFLEAVSHHIRAAELITISLSFGYSGTKDDTRHLAELVVPKILAMRR